MQICFAHDIFRASCGAGNPARNGQWLYTLLAPVLCDAGHSVHRFNEADPAVARDVAAVLDAAGGAGHAAWAALFSGRRWLDAVARACTPLRRYGLVIGYELTPNQMRFLSATGTPFLDVSVDPVRFAPDLFLRMRSNDAALQHALAAYDRPDATLWPHVAALRDAAALHDRAQPEAGEPALLFAGQTDVDASLVTGGRLAVIGDFIGDIRTLLRPGWRLLLKPHPYGRLHHSIRTLRRAFPAATVVSDNIYALINAPFVRYVATLSSGVAQEAALLGRPATALITPDAARESIGCDIVSRDHRVGLDVLSPGFWRALGAGKASARPSSPAPLDGALRRALGQSWGYVPSPRLSRRSLAAGRLLSFGAGGAGGALCTLGWSQPEAAGIWSDGPEALMLVDAGEQALELVLHCSGFVPAGAGPVCVTIRTTPGLAPPQRVVFRDRRRMQVAIGLPPGQAEIAFEITGASSPHEAGLSDDTRRLGLRLSHAVAVEPGGSRFPVSVGAGLRIAASLLAAASGLT